MKKLLIVIILFATSCSEDDVKPESPACRNNTQLVLDQEKAIDTYKRSTLDVDFKVLATMRTELKRLEEAKIKSCN